MRRAADPRDPREFERPRSGVRYAPCVRSAALWKYLYLRRCHAGMSVRSLHDPKTEAIDDCDPNA
jgi:hypothetical protein